MQTVAVTAAGATLVRRARGASGRLRAAWLLVALSLLIGASAGALAVVWAVLDGVVAAGALWFVA